MSIEALQWAKRQTTGSATRKLLLLAVADRANEDWEMWAGQDTLAAETELSVRSVSRGLAELERAGLLVRSPRRRPGGYRTSDLVRLRPVDGPVPDGRSPDTGSPDRVSAGGGLGKHSPRQRTDGHRTQGQVTGGPISPDTVSNLTGHSGSADPKEEPTGDPTAAAHVPRANPADAAVAASGEQQQQLIQQAAHLLALRRAHRRPDVGPGWIINAARGIADDHAHTARTLLAAHPGAPPTAEQLADWLEPPPPATAPAPEPDRQPAEPARRAVGSAEDTRRRLDEARRWQPPPPEQVAAAVTAARASLRHPHAPETSR